MNPATAPSSALSAPRWSDDDVEFARGDVEAEVLHRYHRRARRPVHLADGLQDEVSPAHDPMLRARYAISRSPSRRIKALLAKPITPSVIIAITIVGYRVVVYEALMR